MIKLEQIRLLEQKVQNAVSKIAALKAENDELRSKQDEYQARISELESLLEQYKNEQGEIEQGIISALNRLDELEDVMVESGSPHPPQDTFVAAEEPEASEPPEEPVEAPAESIPTKRPAAQEAQKSAPQAQSTPQSKSQKRAAPIEELGAAGESDSADEAPQDGAEEDENGQELDIF